MTPGLALARAARTVAAAALALGLGWAIAPTHATAATRIFVVNHVASNDVRSIASWNGRLALATQGGLVLADTLSGSTSRYLRAGSELPSDNLLAVAASPSGLLWIGTADRGLARLRPDGTFLRTLTSFDGLPTDRVQAIVRAGDSLWVATSGGVALFAENPATGQIALRRSDSQASTAGGIVSDDVTSLAVWGDTLWAGTNGGLSTFAGGAWLPRTAVTALRVQALLVARDTLWIGTRASGLLVHAGGVTTARGVGSETLALAAVPGGVARGTIAGPFLERSDGVEQPLGTGGLPSIRVRAMHATAAGTVAAGTNAGLARLVAGATPWQAILAPGPSMNGGSRIASNARGLWVTLGNAAPPGYDIGAVLRYDGALWSVLTDVSSGGNLQSAGLIGILASGDGRIWFGHCCSGTAGPGRPRTDRWDPGADVWDRPAAYNQIAFAEAPSGRIYGAGVEHENGVYEFDGGSAALLDSLTPANTAGGLTRENLRAAAFDAMGRGWFATADNGVDRWDGKGTATHADDSWSHFSTGFPDLQTTALAVVSPTDVWVGTRAGAVRLRNDLVDLAATASVNGALGGAAVNGLAVDSEDGVWIASSAGLLRVSVAGTVETFGVAEGIAAEDVLALSWDEGRRVLWALTSGGVSEIHPVFSNTPSFDAGTYVYPNPASLPASLRLGGFAGEVRGEIRDASGARLKTFRADPTTTTVWDLRTAGGEPAAPGIYLVVLRQGDITRILRVAVTR